MDDAPLVRRAQSVGDRGGDLEEPLQIQLLPGHQPVESLALNELHGEEVDTSASSTEWTVTIPG